MKGKIIFFSVFSSVLWIICLQLLLNSMAIAGTIVCEKIVFLEEDGHNCLIYKTNRSDYSSYSIFFPRDERDEKVRLKEHLRNYLYFYPNDYTWDVTGYPGFDRLVIPQGSYALLMRADLSSSISIGKDGTYTFTNWDGKTKEVEGHYGIWNKPEDFSQLVYVWVFPEKFEVIQYKCNRKGKWIRRYNTIAYYGNNVNDLVFTIKYRPRSQKTYEMLERKLGRQDQVRLEQHKAGVKVILGATVLFASGSSNLTETGKNILSQIAEALKKRDSIKIIVEGHTDNVPIKGNLKKIYPTNWELSASRAITVLHYLAAKGISESSLEVRAYGSQRPIATNDTSQGRAKNRRIELLIMEAKEH